MIAGPPEKIADNIQTWFENGAADGFNVMPPWLPDGFDIFAEQVVPILHKRGLFRDDYTGATTARPLRFEPSHRRALQPHSDYRVMPDVRSPVL